MDKQTISILNKILVELGELKRLAHDTVSLVRQKHQGANKSQNSPQNGEAGTDSKVATNISHAEPSKNETTHADKKGRKSFPGLRRFKPLLEVIGILFLIIYTFVTIALWCSSKEANRISRETLRVASENFQKDQRPYVWPGHIEFVAPKIGEPVMANIWYVNYGKTPALKQKSAGKALLFAGQAVMPQADAFFSAFDEAKIVGGSEIILPPGIPPDPKNSLAFITSRSDMHPADQAALDQISKIDGSIGVVGVIIYFDSYGTKYRSDYCAMRLANGNIMWCPRHNEIR